MPFLIYSSRDDRPRWPESSEREVMAAVQGGDEEAFDELIRRKTGPLMQIVGRITRDREEAKDIAQVVFLRVWEKRGEYDSRWSPSTWIYRIGVNLAIDLVRSRQSHQRVIEPLGAHLRSVGRERSRNLADLQDREVSGIFERLAGRLTEKQRLVFLLAAVEGMSSDEVGEILGCKPSTVRNHLFTARKQLRRDLCHFYPEYAPRAQRDDPEDEA